MDILRKIRAHKIFSIPTPVMALSGLQHEKFYINITEFDTFGILDDRN